MHVLIVIKKNTDIRIVSWIHTVKYVKLLYSMRMNKLSLSKKHTLCSWQAQKHQIKNVLHFFILSHHISCLQMNQKTNHSEIKSLFRTFNQEMKRNKFLECWQWFFHHKWWSTISWKMNLNKSYGWQWMYTIWCDWWWIHKNTTLEYMKTWTQHAHKRV